MRLILLFVFSGLFAANVYAKCAGSGIWMLSKTAVLNKNSMIILEFYASSQLLISDLNIKYPVYLQSGNDSVRLKVHQIFKGEFQVTQVIFKPATLLTSNKQYTLMIDNLPANQRKPQRYNERTQSIESLSFTVLPFCDTLQPVLKNAITEVKKTMQVFGCGPAKGVYFSVSAQDSSEIFVRATVTNKYTGKTTTYILPIEDGQVKLGHSMCSGAFLFEKGNSYEVEFTLLDQSGNYSNATKKIAFSSPKTAYG